MLIKPDFGRSPFIEAGDTITFLDRGDVKTTGLVLEVLDRFREGAIAGQARTMEVAVPLDDAGEEGEWEVDCIQLCDVLSRRISKLSDFEEKAGHVLEFDDAKLRVTRP